jgi:uncharacterized phage-associated protein
MLYAYLKRVWKNILMSRPDPQNILQNAITYLCFKVRTLSQTKLMKLIYLANVYHMEQYGSTLAKAPFKHWYYGPFSEGVNNEIEKLCGEGILKYKTRKTHSGYTAEIPMPNVERTTVELTDEAKAVLDDIIEDWGNSSTDDIVNFAKTSLPFVGTPFGKKIDFSRIDLVAEIAKTKNISIEEAATMLVENNEGLLSSLDRARARVEAQGLP